MFTGIIERTGVVEGFVRARSGCRLVIGTGSRSNGGGFLSGLRVGSSLCVNGVCLTLVQKKGGNLFFDLSRETLRRTTLGGLAARSRVNLERPLRYGGRLEGHFVLGHVDGVGMVRKITAAGRGKSFWVQYPGFLRRYLVEKGSIALDGVSLTLGKISPRGFWVHLVPHTLRATNFGAARPGTRVNLEADILAKLVSIGPP